MNKIILFSNIKGGVGKTTTSAHFAEYLTEKGLSAIAVDADLQASLSRHRERELEADPEQQTPWEIVKLNTLDANKLKSDLKKLRQKDSIIIIDCPGNSIRWPTLLSFPCPTMLIPLMQQASLFPSSARSRLPVWCSCPTVSTPQKARFMSVK